MNDVALELASVTKRFGRVTALNSASLTARRGTVHALLGENGAGKTTLMRIAFGMLRPDSGTISVDGTRYTFGSARDAIAAGIGMVHQHFTLVPAMTVAENISLGGRGSFSPSLARNALLELASRTGLPVDPDARVEDLPVGAQQRVEILKALSRSSRVLILDEPTAVLTPTEARELLQKARALVLDGGTAILITHKLRDALEFADDITVLRRGENVWTGAAADATEESLVSAMIGNERAIKGDGAPDSRGHRGEVAMTLNDATVIDAAGITRLRSANLSIHAGEIVGVAAVEGNGQRELLRLLAGRTVASSGEVTIPRVVGFIPEDRQRDALIQEYSLTDNIALLGAGVRRGVMPWAELREYTREIITTFDVRSPREESRMASLSGGNQQKLVVGREMRGSRNALVAENPTRGLDVQATAEVHDRLRAARDAGMAVVVYSSDLDEVLAIADRMIVVHDGQVVEVPLDFDTAGRAMLGIKES
ncbi:MAG: ABC transporter ATP-binding protein [Gemmatimonadota bacterium]|nr:ABC transporter ATP-binding protein [Gemmatimonadota bacterium]